MIKTLARSIKQEKENFRIPHSLQDVIPIRRIWPDGIFRTGNAYSRSYRLTDINYAIAGKADKTAMLLDYSELLNALDSGACAKITILDRCARLVYREYIRGGYRGAPPTLVDLRRILLEQPEAEAHDLALASELYTTGSLNIFAHQTNVDTGARILCYDIRELDEQLRPVGMVVTLDAIFNRVIRNWRQGKRTWILADEFYILFR